MKRVARELVRLAREMVGGKIRDGILSDYKRYGKENEYKVVKAILDKYWRELDEEALYFWDSKTLKVSEPEGEESISTRWRSSTTVWTVEGSVKVGGKTYRVKDVVVDTDVHGI